MVKRFIQSNERKQKAAKYYKQTVYKHEKEGENKK